MSVIQNNDDEHMTTVDFSNMYNKWLEELVLIEKNLMLKANEVQKLQCNLNQETETLKKLNETLLPIQIEQNYLEDHLNSLIKEQEELERELLKLENIEYTQSEVENEEYIEECPIFLESTETELQNFKEIIKETVNKINMKMQDIEKNKNPFSMYRTIMDRYTDALQVLETSTSEIQENLDKLTNVYLQRYIPENEIL